MLPITNGSKRFPVHIFKCKIYTECQCVFYNHLSRQLSDKERSR
uniref:Uncharacterized protein n=1 Tax=Anguilla anguilla TaxID=7936 RepID=A0A0E9QJM6_ANGAN